jgi:hypothetical protein
MTSFMKLVLFLSLSGVVSGCGPTAATSTGTQPATPRYFNNLPLQQFAAYRAAAVQRDTTAASHESYASSLNGRFKGGWHLCFLLSRGVARLA